MKQCYFESIIYIKVNFPEEYNPYCAAEDSLYIKTKEIIINKLKEFGFELNGYDTNCDYYNCYSKDNLLDLITQRSKFLMKSIQLEKTVDILDFKIKSVLIDSKINDEIFPLKK